MSKLLTEQELSDKIVDVLGIRNDLQRHHVLSGAVPTLVGLIQSQKLAHGEMVIGEDDNSETRPYQGNMQRNQLRAEQRERNK